MTLSVGGTAVATLLDVESLLSALPLLSPAEWLWLLGFGVIPAFVAGAIASRALPRRIARARARRRFRRYDHLTARQVREADAARDGA